MLSSTVENYLKRIYLEQQGAADALVSMGRLAQVMGVVPGTVTSMVKTLADEGLVSYEPRGGARLTRSGEQIAVRILRRHRLIELFLVKVLGLDWSEVHGEAEELEHVISDKVLDRIDALLDHPRTDPHGDPIPTAGGKVAAPHLINLVECALKKQLRVARVIDQQVEFLQFVERCGLRPGTLLTVESRDTLADSVTVRPNEGPRVTLGTAAAGKILVQSP